jgi:hypothetical protein
VLLKIVYLLVRQLPGLGVLVFGKDLAKDAELLVLRHENAVLPPRRPDPVRAGRPDMVRRAGATPPPQALDRNLPRDAAGLAPQAGREKARHERAAQARPVGAAYCVTSCDQGVFMDHVPLEIRIRVR